MLFRILVGAVFIVLLFFLYKVYGYRLVLDDVRDNATPATVMGNPSAPLNIIAYVDYDANWSRRAHPVLMKLLATNADTSILYKPLPSVSEGSELAARIALAAAEENRFLDVHNVFMEANQPMTESYIRSAIVTMGMNYENLKAIAYSPKVDAQINSAKRDALWLGINATPVFYVEHIRLEGGGYNVSDFETLLLGLRRGSL